MALIPKEILAPGTYYPLSGPVTFTPSHLEEICRNSSAMLARRAAPIPLEHQDTALPVPLSYADRLANTCLHNSGFARRYYMKEGSLWADLDILEPEVARKIQNGTIPFVSPEIRDHYPADGENYRNVITHIALTCKPVWSSQKPFYIPPKWVGQDGAVAVLPADRRLSLVGHLRLSLADLAPPPETYRLAQPYYVPGGGLVDFDGALYERHVPSHVLAEVEARGDDGKEQVADLLRRLTARTPKQAARAYAALGQPFTPKEPPRPKVSSVGAYQLVPGEGDAIHPFASPHPEHEPVVVHEGANGVALVDGHAMVAGLVNAHAQAKGKVKPPSPRVDVVPAQTASPEEARMATMLLHLMEGRARHDDLVDFFHDTGLPHEDVAEELTQAGFEPHADDKKALKAAWEDARERKESARPDTGPPEEISPRGPGTVAPDDPGGQGPVPGEEVPPLTLSLENEAMKDYLSEGGGKPEPEEKDEKDEGEEEGAEKAEGPPRAAKAEASTDESPEVDKEFSILVGLLKKAGVELDDSVGKMDVARGLQIVNHAIMALEKAGVFDEPMDGGAGGPGAAGPPKPLQEESPMSGPVAMSLQRELHELRREVSQLKATSKRQSAELEHSNDVASKERLNALLASVTTMQEDGRMTKAKGDQFREQLTKHRLSLVSPTPPVELAILLSQLNVYAETPEGTYLEKGAADKNRLSLEEVTNRTPKTVPAPGEISQDRIESILAEFRQNVGGDHGGRNGTV